MVPGIRSAGAAAKKSGLAPPVFFTLHLQRQIDSAEKIVDQSVYELYGLSKNEIQTIESEI